jgi:hypothetical protein
MQRGAYVVNKALGGNNRVRSIVPRQGGKAKAERDALTAANALEAEPAPDTGNKAVHNRRVGTLIARPQLRGYSWFNLAG